MEPTTGNPSFLRNVLVRILLFGVLVIVVRFAYVVTVTGESCNVGDFCFFSPPEKFNFVIGTASGASAIAATNGVSYALPRSTRRNVYTYTSKEWIQAVNFYSSVFQDLAAEGYLSPNAKSLCVETPTGQDVYALKEIGVSDSIGLWKKASKPLVFSAKPQKVPFDNYTFDFIFSGAGGLDKAPRTADFAVEIARTLKPEGYLVAHLKAKDMYSFNSFLNLFNSFKLVKSRDINGFDSSMPSIREIVMHKVVSEFVGGDYRGSVDGHSSTNECLVPGYKHDLIRKAEPLITGEPMKPWITLKRNIQNITYLPSMADISFKNRYVYVDVGARSYGSSIGSWFRKQYPKQNKTFEVYAIEADKAFHAEYRLKKGVQLLPYAAWVKNETLFFEINRDKESDTKGRGMGRIQPLQISSGSAGEVNKIQGFDFAEWLKNTVTEKDFVVMKIDVEGTEFDLIPRLVKTGAICLIDEIFLECHYNRWQRCCPGERSPKYDKTYGQCLDLFRSLREKGVLVHQWW